MSDFIFEDKIREVSNARTKEYLQEVISTYNHKEYRSCITALHATVHIDLLEKYKVLAEYYNDQPYKDFLDDYKSKLESNNIKYSDLERMIITFATDKGILNHVEREQVNQLKVYRDFCAHPVVCKELQLINPTPEQVRAHIRTMFECVFLKDAINYKNLTNDFINDIQAFWDRNSISGLEYFEEYILSKYLNHLEIKTQQKLLKSLWKFLFSYPEDKECKKYRSVVYHSLIILLEKNETMLIDYMQSEKSFFNGNIQFETYTIEKAALPDWYRYTTSTLLVVLNKFPKIKNILTEALLSDIKSVSNRNINYKLCCYFLFDSSNEHITSIKNYMIKHSLNDCLYSPLLITNNKRALDNFDTSYQDLIIYYFFNHHNSDNYCPEYTYLNKAYNNLLSKVIPSFSKKQLTDILDNFTGIYTVAKIFPALCNDLKQLDADKNYNVIFSSYSIDITKYI